MLAKGNERIYSEPEKLTLEKWVKDCPNLKSIFDKAKRENRIIEINIYHSGFGEEVKVIEAKEDYAIVSRILERKTKITKIHPYAGNLRYSIEGLESLEILKE